jgi:hypothetical protein
MEEGHIDAYKEKNKIIIIIIIISLWQIKVTIDN